MTTIVTIKDEGGNEATINVSEDALDHVLRSFNPPGRDDEVGGRVDATKVLCAAVIQQMINLRNSGTPAQRRGASIAISLMEGAQMAAVKANFAKQ